jgi:hypothetical protein
MVSLIPVIEFEPASYSKQTRQSPSVSSREEPRGWELYWRDSLGDSGIDELDAYRPGGWNVPIAALTRPSTLRAMLDAAFGQVDAALEDKVPTDEIPMLAGGYILRADSGEIEPGCCSDFAKIDSWMEAAAWHSSDWKMIWIGHPWTHVSALGDTLTFLRPSEDEPPRSAETLLSVSRGELTAAIPLAVELVNALTERLRSVVAEYHPASASAEIVRVLTWGHRPR